MTETPQELEELATVFETADHSAAIEEAERVNPPSEPMITFSFRVPRDIADKIRAEASRQNRKPTALLRMWVEECLAGRSPTGAPAGLEREEGIELLRQAVHQELEAAGLINESRKLKAKRSRAKFKADKSTAAREFVRRGKRQPTS